MNRTMNCAHISCGKEHRIWLPITDINHTAVEKHPWCVNCGEIKNMSDDQPKNIGHWMNMLAIIAYELNLSQCQKRLIAKEISNCEYLHNTYGSFGSSQNELFISIAEKYCKINSIDIDKILS